VTVSGTVGPTDSVSTILRGLASAQKSSRGAASYSRWVNRPVGRFVAALAFKVGATPNQVTAVAAVFTFGGVALLATLPAVPLVGIVVAALLVLGYAFDAADGQLARLRGGGSLSGEWLDHVIDCIKCSTLHLVVAVAWYRHFDLPPVFFLVPLIYAVQSAVWFFSIMLTDQLRRGSQHATSSVTTGAKPEGRSLFRSILFTPIDYGVLCLSFILLGWHGPFVGVYGVLMIINVCVLALAMVRWYGELARASVAR